MKTLNIFKAMLLVMMGSLLMGCSNEEIVFDHELPAFETRDGKYLLEVIMPQGTNPEDKIYIVGDFNGGLEKAKDNVIWELERSATNSVKWGIYVDPADFENGRTLADGYYFYSASQRNEVTPLNKEIVHTDTPPLGGRANVYVSKWAAAFDVPEDSGSVKHDGYVVYVVDNSGFNEITMYAWGDDNSAFGGWPGMAPTGNIEINGWKLKYFDTKEANKGMNLHLIFNNNNGGSQLPDFNVILNRDYYLELTPSGVKEIDPSMLVKHDGFTVYVNDRSSWGDIALYMWGDVNNLNGDWPGMKVTGTVKMNGITWKYFDLGEANIGKNEHLILNNNGGGKQFDDVVVFALDRDVYIELTDEGAMEVDPATYTVQ